MLLELCPLLWNHQCVVKQHEHVLNALLERDAVALASAIRDDMIEGGRNFVRHLEKIEREKGE